MSVCVKERQHERCKIETTQGAHCILEKNRTGPVSGEKRGLRDRSRRRGIGEKQLRGELEFGQSPLAYSALLQHKGQMEEDSFNSHSKIVPAFFLYPMSARRTAPSIALVSSRCISIVRILLNLFFSPAAPLPLSHFKKTAQLARQLRGHRGQVLGVSWAADMC